MKKIYLFLLALSIVTIIPMVSAGSYIIQYDSADIFSVDTSGNTNATGWMAENGILLSDTYVAIASVASCSAGEYLLYNATGWFCESPSLSIGHGGVTIDAANITTGTIDFSILPNLSNSITLAGENITSGTIDFARLPTLTDAITLDYHNITGIPTCGAGESISYNGTDLSCGSSSYQNLTNVAFINETNTFTPQQVFNAGMNVTGYIELQSAVSGIKRGSTTATIDDTGNFIIILG